MIRGTYISKSLKTNILHHLEISIGHKPNVNWTCHGFICRIEGIEGTGVGTWRLTPKGRTLTQTRATTPDSRTNPRRNRPWGKASVFPLAFQCLIAHIRWLGPAASSGQVCNSLEQRIYISGRLAAGIIFVYFFVYFVPFVESRLFRCVSTGVFGIVYSNMYRFS